MLWVNINILKEKKNDIPSWICNCFSTRSKVYVIWVEGSSLTCSEKNTIFIKVALSEGRREAFVVPFLGTWAVQSVGVFPTARATAFKIHIYFGLSYKAERTFQRKFWLFYLAGPPRNLEGPL